MRKPTATAEERLARRKGNELIPDLTKKDRKVMEEKIKGLEYVLQNCALYLRDYAAGQQTAFKFLYTTLMVYRELAETRDALLTKHKLPYKIVNGRL